MNEKKRWFTLVPSFLNKSIFAASLSTDSQSSMDAARMVAYMVHCMFSAHGKANVEMIWLKE